MIYIFLKICPYDDVDSPHRIMYHHHVPVLRQTTKSTRATILPVIHISFFLRRFQIAHFRSHTRDPKPTPFVAKQKRYNRTKKYEEEEIFISNKQFIIICIHFFSPSIVNFAWTLTQYENCMYARAYKRQCQNVVRKSVNWTERREKKQREALD